MANLIDDEIVQHLKGHNTMDIFTTIPPPVHVPGGGYWLNGTEVDVAQIIKAYRNYAGKATIVVGDRKYALTDEEKMHEEGRVAEERAYEERLTEMEMEMEMDDECAVEDANLHAR